MILKIKDILKINFQKIGYYSSDRLKNQGQSDVKIFPCPKCSANITNEASARAIGRSPYSSMSCRIRLM